MSGLIPDDIVWSDIMVSQPCPGVPKPCCAGRACRCVGATRPHGIRPARAALRCASEPSLPRAPETKSSAHTPSWKSFFVNAGIVRTGAFDACGDKTWSTNQIAIVGARTIDHHGCRESVYQFFMLSPEWPACSFYHFLRIEPGWPILPCFQAASKTNHSDRVGRECGTILLFESWRPQAWAATRYALHWEVIRDGHYMNTTHTRRGICTLRTSDQNHLGTASAYFLPNATPPKHHTMSLSCS